MHISTALGNPLSLLVSSVIFLTGCTVSETPYGVTVTPAPPPTVVVGTPTVVVSPVYVRGYGYGYWYRGNYWPYRRGCHFYHGRYYGGYRGYY